MFVRHPETSRKLVNHVNDPHKCHGTHLKVTGTGFKKRTEVQCIWAVFRPLEFFHVLLHYSLFLKCIQSLSPSSVYTQYPIMTKQKQVFRNFCKCIQNKKFKYHIYINVFRSFTQYFVEALFSQRLQPQVFLGMTLQAWHNCIWGVSPTLLCRSSQVLRLNGECRCIAIFRSLQRC